jgi:hypothetical protein
MANFSITGEFITEHARELWIQKDFKKAMDYLEESIEGFGREYQLQLLEGKMKLTGKGNNMDFVEDKDFDKNDYGFYPSLSDAFEIKKESESLYENELSEQREKALYIIDSFKDFQGTSSQYEKEKHLNLVRDWIKLFPEVKKEFEKDIPFYMSLWLREITGKNNSPVLNLKFGNLTHKSIIHHLLPPDHEAWKNKKLFELYCKKYHIYLDDEINEIWEGFHEYKEYIKNPIESKPKLFNTDYKMQQPFGWLGRNGEYYYCNYTLHNDLADYICALYEYNNQNDIDSSHILESKGWVKIHVNDENKDKILFSSIKPFSEDQKKKIKRYCKYYNIDEN